MALSRKLLKSIGLTDEQIEAVIENNEDTITALKGQISTLTAERDGLQSAQKELDALKAGKDWKAEHDRIKSDFDAYRATVAGQETARKVERAFRGALKKARIDERRHDVIVRASGDRLKGLSLNDKDGIDDEEKLIEDLQKEWSDFVVSTKTRPDETRTPPETGKVGMTRDEILAIKDTGERQRAMLENRELFGI